MIVADSDVLIDALRGREPARARVALEIRSGSLHTTVVNAFELLSGAPTEKERQRVERLLGAIDILPLDATASRRAAEVRRSLESAGRGIGTADYLIAGICLARGGLLLTRKHEHFARVPDLVLGRLGEANQPQAGGVP